MLHVFAVLAAALLFATTGTSMALGPDDTTPLSVGAVRLVIGATGLAVTAFVLVRRHARGAFGPAPCLGIRPLALKVLTGFCLALYQPLFFLGTERNGVAVGTVVALWLGLGGLTAATAATLTLGEPLTANILGIVVLGERLSALAIVGLVILAAGLALLAWGSRAPRDPVPFAVEG